MANAIDVKYINPFVKASITILGMLGLGGATFGKPSLSDLRFPNNTFLIQVGITGAMKGQVFLKISEDKAKKIASTMMMGMPIDDLDPMACSALGELGNMIMGNTATIFSNMDIIFDITPPVTMFGKKIVLQTDMNVISIPIVIDGAEYINLYLCIKEDR